MMKERKAKSIARKQGELRTMTRMLSCLLLLLLPPTLLCAQDVSGGGALKAGDRIESTSYNDHKRGTPRSLQYLPDGEDFLCINGENRYTRALYGSHTAWRLETSDRPIFATYVKGDCRNISFRLALPDGTTTRLEETTRCEARYRAGRRDYLLEDEEWPEGASVSIAVLASMTEGEERALWQITTKALPENTLLYMTTSPIRQAKLSRSGDMGADPPRAFDPADDVSTWTTDSLLLHSDTPIYIAVEDNVLSCEADTALFGRYEQERQALAHRIVVDTPDPYLNTLGGVLATAADGIWSEEDGVWLHGAVGWRMPLSGWRAAYTGDALGWHDRARAHFDNYAASQVTEVPCTIPHPAQDTKLNLARSAKKWGTPQYSNGYICRNPRRNNQMHHYDMNLCYADELIRHLLWTGDLEYARQIWPVIVRHLEWEKLNYDPDDDGLYDAYACIWASDALYYNSGAVTHSSAYNFFANRAAARIAEKIGEDPTPYQREADRTLSALNSRLWLNDEGHWAEFQDFMGHRRLHKHAGVWTIYHAIDSRVGNEFQNYLATRYVDEAIPHIPVIVAPDSCVNERFSRAAIEINGGRFATISTTDWLPYSWSINNVAFAEVMHTALAYFQARRPEEGFRLMKSSILDGMYLGESPGNVGQISFYDAARGECYRDFGDPVGVASRLLVEGLYGITPNALEGRLLICPGLPDSWPYARLHTPDIDFSFSRQEEDRTTSYVITHRLSAVDTIELQFPALSDHVEELTVNGLHADYSLVANSIGHPILAVVLPAASGSEVNIRIRWSGREITDPSVDIAPLPEEKVHREGEATFAMVTQGNMSWWKNISEKNGEPQDVSEKLQDVSGETSGHFFEHVRTDQCKPQDISTAFNDSVTHIFRPQYYSPRSPYTTLQIPLQGISEWCHPLATAEIDDSGLRRAATNGQVLTSLGIPFRTPQEGDNIAFTSLWDNYPDSLRIDLEGQAGRAYLLMAGSTNHMQCHIANGVVRIHYTDGSFEELVLENPTNWAPIEQIFFEDGLAFDRHAPSLYRLSLKTGEVSNRFGETLPVTGAVCSIDGGAATLLEVKLDPGKTLSHLTLETLSNEVVIGLMAITLQAD